MFFNYYMNSKNSFDHCLNAVNGKKGTKKYIVYKHLKPLLIEKIKECASLEGFKSIRINLDHFLNCFFLLFNGGIQLIGISEQMSLRTFYKYYNLMHRYGIFENAHKDFITSIGVTHNGVTDSMCVKSFYNKAETNYFYKQKGKRGVKISLLSGINKVIYAFDVKTANMDDRPAFTEMVKSCKNSLECINVYADSGYDGEKFTTRCKASKINMISVPRKNNKGICNRFLSVYDSFMMRKKRPYIEHINLIISSYRSLSIKTTHSIARFTKVY